MISWKPNEVKYPSILSNLFSASLMKHILLDSHVQYVTQILSQTGLQNKALKGRLSIHNTLVQTFDYLKKYYRCEYVYKTAILNELLMKRHSLKDSLYLTEFRAVSSKADIVILNGTSTVYEIKSDIDNLDRLSKQMLSYSRIFDKVYVVTNEKNQDKVCSIIPPSVGVIILNFDLSTELYREAYSNLSSIDKGSMFDCLRKTEYLPLIRDEYGQVPNVPNTQIFSVCRDLFCELSIARAHQLFLINLKRRKFESGQVRLVETSDYSLKGVLLEKKYSEKECEILKFGLSKTI